VDTEDEDIEDFPEGSGSNDVVDAVERVESAVALVEQAIKDKWSSVTIIGWLLIGAFLWNVPGDIWHAKWRYAMSYGVDSGNVIVAAHPHDCAFLAAPLGEKYCHYERGISTLRWATSTTGNAIASWDEGKTWSVFTPDAGVSVPKYATVHQVYINWKKIEE
jgi:hypothetical protein